MRRSPIFIFLLLLSLSSFAQSPWQTEIDSIGNWIANRLFINAPGFPNADGAIVLTPPGPGSCQYQSDYYQVVIPTFATGCAQALLRSTRPDKQDLTFRFMNWFSTHYDAYSLPLPTKDSTHWYYKTGGNPDIQGYQIGCNWPADPAYGDAALPQLCILAFEYFQITKDTTWFWQPGIKAYLETNMDYIIDTLLQPNDLTWGDAGYQFTLCMDNSAGFWGFDYMGRIEHYIYHDPVRASKYLDVSGRIRRAVQTTLFNASGGLPNTPDSTYLWYPGGTGFDTTLINSMWYPLVTSTIWPQANGVDNPCGARSRLQRNLVTHFFDGNPYPDWTNTPTQNVYMDLAYACAYAGDTTLAIAHLNNAKGWYFYNFNFPYTGADALWNALAYEKLIEKPDCNDGDLTRSYCNSSGIPVSDNTILYVDIADVQQTTGKNDGYFNYKDECFEMRRDTSYEIVLYPIKRTAAGSIGVNWRIWVDADQNGTFDGNELALDIDGNNVDPIQTSFSIPASWSLGYTAMRICLKSDTSIRVGPCDAGFDGDVEDYCLNVQNRTVGIEDGIAQTSLLLFPNPILNEIRFEPALQFDSEYEILDIAGRKLLSGTTKSNRVELEELSGGIYFLRLEIDGSYLTKKFIKF